MSLLRVPSVLSVWAGVLLAAILPADAAAPYAATQPALQITGTSATLSGMAVPNGQNSAAWFEWGTNPGYGQTNAAVVIGSGATVVRLTSPVTGLIPGEVYAFRLAVSNASGVVYGAPQTFATGKKVAAWGDNSSGQSSVPTGYTEAVAVACGWSHSLAVDVSGRVSAWGMNSYGVTNVPAGLSSVSAVAAGRFHSLALKADGTIVGWGDNFYNKATAPANATNIIAIAAGYNHSLALKADGSVVVWGDNFFGQTSMPADVTNAVAIASGDDHSLALLANGTVKGWGEDIFGQSTVPAGLTNVVGIACGAAHSIALKRDGTVVTWGWPLTTPPGLAGVTSVAGGWVYAFALKLDRTVTGWGSGFPNIYAPPAGLVNVAAISAGGQHSLAISDNTPPIAIAANVNGPFSQDLVIKLEGWDPNGDLLSFRITGLPAAGALYQYDAGNRGVPIVAGSAVTDLLGRVIYAPRVHAFGTPYTSFTFSTSDGVLDSPEATVTVNIIPTKAATGPATEITAGDATLNGTILPNGETTFAWFEWGANDAFDHVTTASSVGSTNSLALLQKRIAGLAPDRIYRSRLVVSNEAVGVLKSAAQSFTSGLRLAGWGSSASGQTNFPAGTTNIVGLASGGGHSIALRAGGSVLAWGLNTYGQTNVPTWLANVVAVRAGGSHSLALTSGGKVVAWGRNTFGQTNVPVSLTNAVAIGAGVNHSLAVRVDGRVMAWGDNGGGQTNVPAIATNVIAVAGSISNSFAVRVDGSVIAWGGSSGGVLSIPAAATNVTAVAAGNFHVLALRADGRVIAWGTNNYGQATVPATATNIVAIAAGGNHSLALKEDGTVVAWGLGNSGQTNIPAGLVAVAISGGDAHSIALGNVAPVANPCNAWGYVSHDVVVGLSGTDLNKDSISFRLLSLPLQGVLYQYDQGTRGAAITAGNALVTDPFGRIIYAPAPGSLETSYASFVANDGIANSTQAMVSIGLKMPSVPSFSGGPSLSGGKATLTFTGSSNATYSIWGSTNLSAWSYLGIADPLPGNSYQFQDAEAGNWTRRFYRVSAP